MTSCIGAVVSEELLSIFMVVQEEGLDCSVDECSKLFGNVACIQLYIASYSRSMNVQVVCEGHCKLLNSFGRFEGTAILRNVGTLCNITEDSNFRNLNNKCICKLQRFFSSRKGVRKPIFRLEVLWDTKCEFETAETTNPENVVMRHEHVDHSVRICRLYKSGAHPRGAAGIKPPKLKF